VIEVDATDEDEVEEEDGVEDIITATLLSTRTTCLL
ncbi:unnamed protein product, partial [Didymodactylos carnosus]